MVSLLKSGNQSMTLPITLQHPVNHNFSSPKEVLNSNMLNLDFIVRLLVALLMLVSRFMQEELILFIQMLIRCLVVLEGQLMCKILILVCTFSLN